MLSFKLPKKLARFTPNLYAPIASRIESFRVAVQNNEAAQLVLSSDDINSLWSIFSDEFCKLPSRTRSRLWVPFFEIHNNKIIQELVIYPLWIFPWFTFSWIMEIRYTSRDKEHLQLRRQAGIGRIEIPEELRFYSEDQNLSSYFGLIGFILGSDEYRRINLELLRNPYNFLEITERGTEANEDLKSILRKVNSIEIRDKLLIISANN